MAQTCGWTRRGLQHVFLLCNMTFNCITSSGPKREGEGDNNEQLSQAARGGVQAA